MFATLQQICSDVRNGLEAWEASQTAANGDEAKAAADYGQECLERAQDSLNQLLGRFTARAKVRTDNDNVSHR